MFFDSGGRQGNIQHPGEEIISRNTFVHISLFFLSFFFWCVGVAGVEHGPGTSTEDALVLNSEPMLFLSIVSFGGSVSLSYPGWS